MIKILSGMVVIASTLFSQSFDLFLNRAITNSPYLKSSHLGITQAGIEGSKLTRYNNPELEVEYSHFKPTSGARESGFRIAVSQPIRLYNIGDDKADASQAMIKNATAYYTLSRAQFVKKLSLLYVAYVQAKRYLHLADEELEIAHHIYQISDQRYQAGSISKGVMLQAKVDYERISITLQDAQLQMQQLYFELLNAAGETQEIALDTTTPFHLHVNSKERTNPQLHYLQTTQESSRNMAKVNTHAVEWIDLVAEYENEPDQDIMRVGASIPLALFNTKSQERRLWELKAKDAALLIDAQERSQHITLVKLQKERETLAAVLSKNRAILQTQNELLSMFKEGYKIAKTDLLELQNIKNSVIATKKRLIDTEASLHQNIITTNYITGAYND